MREKNLKIEESHFYAFSRITRNFLVKHAVKLLVPSSRNDSPAQVANIHSVMTLRAVRQMSFYEIVETAQAILVNYILIDGSAQAVSNVVEAISVFLKRLR